MVFKFAAATLANRVHGDKRTLEGTRLSGALLAKYASPCVEIGAATDFFESAGALVEHGTELGEKFIGVNAAVSHSSAEFFRGVAHGDDIRPETAKKLCRRS